MQDVPRHRVEWKQCYQPSPRTKLPSPPMSIPPPGTTAPPHPGGNRCQLPPPPPPGGIDTIANEQITAAYYVESCTTFVAPRLYMMVLHGSP